MKDKKKNKFTWASLSFSIRISSIEFLDSHSDPERKEVDGGGTTILSWYLLRPLSFSAASYHLSYVKLMLSK